MSSEPPSPLDLDDAPTIWDRLCRHVEAFAAAWDASHQPPPIASFLPAEPAVLRKLVLVELIKIDLEYRGQHQCPLRLEDYAARFPELGGRDGLPCDLIYEEYHVRKGTSPDLSPGEYLERFPQQAESLRRLLDLPSAHTLSTLMRPSAADRLAAAPIADFEVLGTLGAGAFATVYLARQLSMQRMVALKVTSPRGDEPQTLAQLDHPHIVRVLDQRSDAEGARRLLYMEWVPGGTLQAVVTAARERAPEDRTGKLLLEVIDRHLAAHGVLPPDDAERERLAAMPWFEVTAYLGAQLAAALDCAHRRGILHRDVKPANVLLTASGRAKLADFNVSYSSKLDGAAPAAYFGGSLAYMPPEQLEAFNPRHPRQPAELDGRSDLYALAVVLWELLCGRRPFADEGLGGDWAATLERLCERRRRGPPPEALSRLPPQTPPLFVETLLRCLEPDAAARPQTARDLYAQLRSVLQPRLRDLLTPPRGRWSETIRRHLAAAIILAGLLPNAFLSVLNISYNWMVTVAALDEAAQRLFLEILLILLNGIFYSLATVVALRAAWPVIRSVRGPPRADLDFARRRCLTLGDPRRGPFRVGAPPAQPSWKWPPCSRRRSTPQSHPLPHR